MSSCSICQNLRPEWLDQLPKGQKAICFVQLQDLKDSASKPSPCPECALVWNALSLYKENWADTNFDRFVELVIGLGKPLRLNWHDDVIQLELFSTFTSSGGSNLSDAADFPLDTIGPACQVSDHSESPACFELAAMWLSDCLKSHYSCRPPSVSVLPTRLIHVGSASQQPVLVNTKGRTGRYVALSYCWGSEQAQVFKTTKETRGQHMKGIDFNALSKTLQDAIKIARYLGVEYLWVDAFCIIQEDPDDWAREVSMMSQVYLNAYVTISADNSLGCNRGIFNKQVYGAAAEQLPYKDGYSVMVRKAFAQEHNKYSVGIRGLGEDTEPISSRAWTLQEFMLSNRILRYTTKELIWECNEAWCCECGFMNARKNLENDDEVTIRNVAAFAKLPKDVIFDEWDRIVMRMTERSLTDGRDKLPALSGLATQFAKALRIISPSEAADRYLAGHWYGNLVRSLYWRVEDDLYRPQRTGEFIYRRARPWRAPSWSWASTDGPVEYSPDLDLNVSLKVIEVSTVTSTVDTYGQVSSGTLVCRGRIVHGLPMEISEARTEDRLGGFSDGLTYAIRNDGGIRTFTIDDTDDHRGCEIGLNHVGLSCLLIGHLISKGAVNDQEEIFLVLRPTGDSKDINGIPSRVFERVGASLRSYMEPNMDTLGQSARDSSASTKMTRLFDTAEEGTIVIV